MESLMHTGAGGVFLSCFLLSIVSALVPWVNGEVVLLASTAIAHSPWQILSVVLLTSAGQMVGKCVLYWTARRAIPVRSVNLRQSIAIWKQRFSSSPAKPLSLVFISSTLGIPPFYILTVMAGFLQLKFVPYLLLGSLGRVIRFGLLAVIPALALRFVY
jgi:membrane protein YqaA with SNARE-associated domain